jgi:hypothetical protein
MFEPDAVVLESSDRPVPTPDDAVENRLECVPMETMEGTRQPPGTPVLLTALAFSSACPS